MYVTKYKKDYLNQKYCKHIPKLHIGSTKFNPEIIPTVKSLLDTQFVPISIVKFSTSHGFQNCFLLNSYH